MAQSVITSDLLIQGNLNCAGVFSTSATISNDMVASNAKIAATKLEHQTAFCVPVSNHGTAPSAVRKTICRVRGTTGTVTRFEAGVIQAVTAGTVTVDLLKNGSSILASAITLNATGGTGGTALDVVTASFASTTLAQNDILEVSVTVSTPSGGGGCFAQATIRQDAA